MENILLVQLHPLSAMLASGCSDDTGEKITDAGDVDKDPSFRPAPNFTLLNTELEEVRSIGLSGQSCYR